jgi:hypothetical protein
LILLNSMRYDDDRDDDDENLIMTCTCTEDRLSDSHIPHTYVLDFVYEF